MDSNFNKCIMTKEEKIKEAYGVNWDLCKDYVDENGYCVVFKDADQDYKGVAGNQTTFEESEIEGGIMTHSIHGPGISFRPKTLKGIEHNNGWNKIESDDDLPKEYGIYHVRDTNSHYYNWRFNDFNKPYCVTQFTHWKPIVKDLPPIY